MIFEEEDLEDLQRWLEIHLKPLCDADPQALTRYVIALLKKDQPEDALRITMAHQLEIFLQDATSPFLDRLFSCINSGEYRNSVQKVLISENKNPIDSEETLFRSEQIINKDEKQACQSSTLSKMSERRRRVSESSEEISSSDDDETKSSDVCQQKTWRDKRSRSASIGISPHRKRNRLERGRSGFISRSNRQSPSKRRARGEMSFNNHRLPGSANRRRYHSPSRRSASRSRSRSFSLSPIRRRKVRPPSPSESNSLLENITTKCSVKSVVVKPTDMSLVGPNDRNLTSRGRCPDYDEQGVCMLGECCPFDHGSDPVILNDGRNSETSPTGPCYQKSTGDEYFPESPAFTGGAPRFVGWGPGLVRRPIRPKTVYMNQFLHRGNIMRHGMLRNLGLPMMCPPRQLVPVPVDGNVLRGHVPPPGYIPDNPFAHLGPRVGVRSPFGNRGRSIQPIGRVNNIRLTNPDLNTCLAVRKIPRAMNKIEGLINHFSRFGNVVTIQVGFDGDPEGALVVFQSHHDALLAYRSTEAVLNNRFIRVFWHNQEVDTTSQSATGSKDIPAETTSLTHASERSNEIRQSWHESNNEAAVRLKSAVLSLPATVDSADDGTQILSDTSECVTSTVPSATEVPPTRMFRKGLMHSKPSEARKQEMVTLLNSHLNEQKQLILKYEADKKRMTPKQRDELLQLIKNLQTSCEQLKCEIAKIDSFKAPGNSEERVSILSQDEMKRTILDQELEDYMWERKRYDPDQNKPLSD